MIKVSREWNCLIPFFCEEYCTLYFKRIPLTSVTVSWKMTADGSDASLPRRDAGCHRGADYATLHHVVADGYRHKGRQLLVLLFSSSGENRIATARQGATDVPILILLDEATRPDPKTR